MQFWLVDYVIKAKKHVEEEAIFNDPRLSHESFESTCLSEASLLTSPDPNLDRYPTKSSNAAKYPPKWITYFIHGGSQAQYCKATSQPDLESAATSSQ
jgi:hypothetical protein